MTVSMLLPRQLAMHNECTQRLYESLGEPLNDGTTMHILAVYPFQLQSTLQYKPVDLQQVTTLPSWAVAGSTSLTGWSKWRSLREKLVPLTQVIKKDLSLRQRSQLRRHLLIFAEIA
jgi:hypothetical protein